MVWVRVNAYEALRLYRKACILFYFTLGALRDGLPDVHDPPGSAGLTRGASGTDVARYGADDV